MCTTGQPTSAQLPTEQVEEIHRTESVGANQLALRALLIEQPISVTDESMPTVAFKVPARINPATVMLEVRDRNDKGYYLRASRLCVESGPCEHRWAAAKMREVGITLAALWPVTKSGDPTSDGALIPTCLCSRSELGEREKLVFVFVPSKTINLRYYIYDDAGLLLDSAKLDAQPAGAPLVIGTNKANDVARRYKLVVNHIASAGGSAERFSDSFYFFGS
jgi:hypothetical protein